MPYSLCPDKETRNCFRRFQAANPEKFDYSAAQIPVEKPLTPEEEARQAAKRNEKKKAQRAAKKEKEKASKAAEEEKKKDEAEKNRFLNLSDREKRALAAEKRILASAGSLQVSVLLNCFSRSLTKEHSELERLSLASFFKSIPIFARPEPIRVEHLTVTILLYPAL